VWCVLGVAIKDHVARLAALAAMPAKPDNEICDNVDWRKASLRLLKEVEYFVQRTAAMAAGANTARIMQNLHLAHSLSIRVVRSCLLRHSSRTRKMGSALSSAA